MAKVGTPGAISAPPIAAKYLGQGVAYPLRIDSFGRLALSFGVQSVEDSLRSIIMTVPKERVMLIDYGMNIFTFEPIDLGRFQILLEQQIAEHEPRITKFSVDVAEEDVSQGHLNVTVEYTIASQATPRTLTFPYFLGPT